MRIEAIQQCDAITGGSVKALFPGQRYDLEESAVAELLAQGKVRALVSDTSEVKPVTVKARTRAKA